MNFANGIVLAADTTTRLGSGFFVVICVVAALATFGKKSDKPRSRARKGGAGFFVALAVIAAIMGGGGKSSTPNAPTHTTPSVSTSHKPAPSQHSTCKPHSLICFH